MENTHNRVHKRRTDYGMNTDMPLDVFAKLCVTEVKKLRVEVGALHAEITEKDDKIAALEKQVSDLQNILESKSNKYKSLELEAIRQVKSDEMYNQLKRNNRLLKQQIDRMRREMSDCVTEALQNQIKQQKND